MPNRSNYDYITTNAVKGMFFLTLKNMVEQSWISKLSHYFVSNQASETYSWLGQAPVLRKALGGDQSKELRENKLIITNEDYEATMKIWVKDHRRDKTGQIQVRINELAKRTVTHWEKLLSTLLANGTGSTSGLCYDGQYFFDDDHVDGDSGIYKNLLTSSEVATLDVTTAAAPTAAEAISAIMGVLSYMMTYKDDQGEPINDDAKEFIIMTSPALWMRLVPAAVSDQITSGETNALKKLEVDGFKLTLVPNARLTYTTQFLTFRADSNLKPLIRQEEVKPDLSALGPISEYAIEHKKCLYKVETSRNVAYGMPQFAAHATLS